MKLVSASWLLCWGLFWSGLLMADSLAMADDTSCYLEASIEDTQITVYEKVAWGPATEEIWTGVLKKYEKKLIRSRSGKIGYDYRLGSSDLTTGDNEAECRDGNTITIP